MIITLCGSARFEPWFHHWNEILSLAGHCVFGLGVYPSWKEGDKNWYSEEEKRVLDQVHIGKIANSDGIVVLNVFSYIGDSTMNEIEAARVHGKDVYFLESWGKGCGIGPNHFKEIREAALKYIPKGYTSPIDTSYRFENKAIVDLLGPAGQRRSDLIRRINKFRKEYEGKKPD
jgi:hypothetical protein